MEHRQHEYKIVMEDGADSIVLADLADLDIALAAFWAAAVKWPSRPIDLRQGTRVVRRRVHTSCCAVNNAPALPPGPCDCGADQR